jgi:hypothetical protein
MASDYRFGILWPLYCLSSCNLWLLITALVSCGHCIVSPAVVYGFWFPLWYLVPIVLSLITARETIQWPQDTKAEIRSHKLQLERQYNGHKIPKRKSEAINYGFGILWPLYCLSSCNLWLLITALVSCGHCIVSPAVVYGFMNYS